MVDVDWFFVLVAGGDVHDAVVEVEVEGRVHVHVDCTVVHVDGVEVHVDCTVVDIDGVHVDVDGAVVDVWGVEVDVDATVVDVGSGLPHLLGSQSHADCNH